ncbi:hypothetical protein ACRRVA_01185 [Candidatus Cardinium hertigii]
MPTDTRYSGFIDSFGIHRPTCVWSAILHFPYPTTAMHSIGPPI